MHAEVCGRPGLRIAHGLLHCGHISHATCTCIELFWAHTHLPGLLLCCWGHSSGVRAVRCIYIVCDTCAAAGVVLSCTPHCVCSEPPSLVGLSALAGTWAAASWTGANPVLAVAEWQHLSLPGARTHRCCCGRSSAACVAGWLADLNTQCRRQRCRRQSAAVMMWLAAPWTAAHTSLCVCVTGAVWVQRARERVACLVCVSPGCRVTLIVPP